MTDDGPRRIVNRTGTGSQRLFVQANPLPYSPATLDTTQARLAELLAPLPPSTRDTIVQALCALQPLFTPRPESDFSNVMRDDHA